MATTTPDQNLDRRETAQLIGSDKVEGTPVYRSNGDHIGQIERIMIDKISGKVAYAVMSFGGFVGIGEDYYPLPWSLLTYNTRLEGYEVNVSEQQRQRRAEIFQVRELGLVRPCVRPESLRLLRPRSTPVRPFQFCWGPVSSALSSKRIALATPIVLHCKARKKSDLLERQRERLGPRRRWGCATSPLFQASEEVDATWV